MKSSRLHVARWLLAIQMTILAGPAALGKEPAPSVAPLLTGAGTAQVNA